MTNEELLAEIEDVLRTQPPLAAFGRGDHDTTLPWLGRAAAAVENWNPLKAGPMQSALERFHSDYLIHSNAAFATVTTLLHQARSDLRMKVGQLNVVMPKGQVFDYFDELRRVIETASTEVFFVDPYLDAEFVSRYLPQVRNAVAVRLLGGGKRMTTLLPAVDLFTRQHAVTVHVRSSDQLHDRYLFTDRSACYVSGASFKDGAKNAPAHLTQILDAFSATWNTYETLWGSAKIERN